MMDTLSLHNSSWAPSTAVQFCVLINATSIASNKQAVTLLDDDDSHTGCLPIIDNDTSPISINSNEDSLPQMEMSLYRVEEAAIMA